MIPDVIKFKKGLPFIKVALSNSHTVTFLLLVHIGSRHEEAQTAGIAHLLEHMMGKRTKSYPAQGQLAEEIELLGGEYNAFTSKEYTGYYLRIPSHNKVPGLKLFSQIITDTVFDDIDLQTERGVVIEEIKMYRDEPREVVGQKYSSEIFAGDQLGCDIAGEIETVEKISIADIEAFKRKNYVASNCTLVIAGDLEKLDDAHIEEAFSGIPEGEVLHKENFVQNELNARFVPLEIPSQQVHMALGGYSYNRGTQKYPMKIGETILGQGFGSMLFKKIRDEMGIAYYIGAGGSRYNDVGHFCIRAGLETKRCEMGIEEILKAIKNIADGKFSELQLERARNYLLGGFATELETSSDMASWYGMQYLLRKEIKTPEQEKLEIQHTTKDKIVEAWQQIISPKNFILVASDPERVIKRFDPSAIFA